MDTPLNKYWKYVKERIDAMELWLICYDPWVLTIFYYKKNVTIVGVLALFFFYCRLGSVKISNDIPDHLSPTKIADRFKNLYEVEWYAAVGVVATKKGTRQHQTTEEEDYSIYKLLRIIRVNAKTCVTCT